MNLRLDLLARLPAVMRWEWRRQRSFARLTWLVLLAALPVALMAVRVWIYFKFQEESAALREEYAAFFHGLVVRVVLFFGCLTLFLGGIRGEVEQKTLHYLYLAPLPRWMLVTGKYVAAVILAWILFGASTIASWTLARIPDGLGSAFGASGLRELGAYLAMTLLGSMAYGALFLAVGTLFPSPGWIVAVLFFWEWVHFLLPPVLKQLSVVHYLNQLTPIPVSEGPFAILAAPEPPGLTVAKLLLYCLLAVSLASFAVTKSELNYGK